MNITMPAKLDVLVVLGSLSDKELAKQMRPVFEEFEIAAHYAVCSAHRDHERLGALVAAAEEAGARAIVAVAGMAAHLPGVCAALSVLPVIGVPGSSGLLGVDALLAIVQMPPGIPVATVGIDAGRNAALLACEIAAVARPEVGAKLKELRATMRLKNREDDAALREALKG
jgi:5-(carboxyamino)imidazole ribonucleotide mutase